jgi:N-acylglucosamine 2-epimerase
MKRRNFLSNLAVGGLTVGTGSGLIPRKKRISVGSVQKRGRGIDSNPAESGVEKPYDFFRIGPSHSLKKIGSRTVEEIRRHFQIELFEDTIPYWEKYGVDRQYGGYLKADKKSGIISVTDKDLYSQGRILWIFSYLYNHFGGKQLHLEAARQGKEILVKNCLLPSGHWGTLYTRDWKQIEGFFDIYADIYMILGLAEYYRASGDAESLRLAVETCYRVTETILAPHYQGQGHGSFFEPGVKRMGTWAHFLFPITLLLQYNHDEGIGQMARMCVRNMLQCHWQRDKGFAYEFLDDRYEPYPDDYLSLYSDGDWVHLISGWHNIQGAWKTMHEAIRVKNRDMFNEAMRFGFQVLEKHMKIDGDCRLVGFDNVEKWRWGEANEKKVDNSLYDVFLFCLLAIEYTHSPEAIDWFEKAFNCALSKPGGINNGSLTLHEPRGIMIAIQILQRMIDRGGGPSLL